jgi:hypothetical protein
MKHSRSYKVLFIALSLLALTLLVHPLVTTSAEQGGLQAAWQRAQQAGSYRFTADAEQTLIPRPIPSMIGQTDERVDLRIEGDVTLPDHARLQLRFEGAGLNTSPLELIQDGTETYLLKDGEKMPVNNPAALSSPTADYLGYLAAAENVRLSDQGAVTSDQSPTDDTHHASRITHHASRITCTTSTAPASPSTCATRWRHNCATAINPLHPAWNCRPPPGCSA